MTSEIKEIHSQDFYKTIDDFFDRASASSYVQNQHDLLNNFLDSNIKFKDDRIVQDIVF